MKTILKILCLFIIGLNTITAQNQTCEDKWNEVKSFDASDRWKETNTISSGKVYWKSIEYFGHYSFVHKLYRVASTGHFYVQKTGFNNMVYYTNEKDAIRALYLHENCQGYFTNKGRVGK